MVYRVYVEKKEALANEAKALKNDIVSLLQIKGLRDLRLLNRYDVENIEKDLFDYIDSAHPDITQSIRDTKDLTGENEERLKEALNEYVEKFLKSK